MIRIVVNGQERELPAATSLADLIATLGLPADGIAAAVDGTVIPRPEHASTPLRTGSRVEIIRAVGGG